MQQLAKVEMMMSSIERIKFYSDLVEVEEPLCYELKKPLDATPLHTSDGIDVSDSYAFSSSTRS